jgi:O-antigen/teichoic acid export membrane protein
MSSALSSNKTIAKNTLFLYFRLIFTIIVTLYTSRVILNVLGINDFGLYNVVGGIVIMFTFLNTGMVQASQRFISFEIARKNFQQLKDVFATTLTIHFLLAILFFVFAELIGLWFLNTQMNIDSERMIAANWVYQCSILAFMINIITVPYNAAIIAHEQMSVYAYVSILEVSLRLFIVYFVQWADYDQLIAFSVLQLIIAVVIRIVYGEYCRKKYSECKFKLLYDKKLFHKILSFASWSFVGNLGFTFRNQGINILINIFFGTAINAARGIAYQVSAQVSGFVSNFQMAIIPQITKRYAANEIGSMLDIVYKGSKYSFFLLYVMALPVIFKAPYILYLWLGNVPEYTVEFLRLVLIVSLIDCTAIPLGKAIDATGSIKVFQIVVAIIMLTDIPISYFLLTTGVKAYCVMYVAISTSLIGLFARLFLLKRNIQQVNMRKYILTVLLRCLLIVGISFFLMYNIKDFFADTILGVIEICIVTLIINGIIFYLIGMQSAERKFVLNKIKNIVFKKILK